MQARLSLKNASLSGSNKAKSAADPTTSDHPGLARALREGSRENELCGRLGDEIDQAAWFAGILMTSMPFWNLTPWGTLGN